jgi:hypothetical protein
MKCCENCPSTRAAGDAVRRPALQGSLRVRHAVVTVTDPRSGELWTFPDVDWLLLDVVGHAGVPHVDVKMTGEAQRDAEGLPVTLTRGGTP